MQIELAWARVSSKEGKSFCKSKLFIAENFAFCENVRFFREITFQALLRER